MDSLKALVARWREEADADEILVVGEGSEAARGGMIVARDHADQLEAAFAALADTGTLTDEQIEREARSRYDGVEDEDFVDGAKWARDYRTPSVPTKPAQCVLDGLRAALDESADWDEHPQSSLMTARELVEDVLALYPNTKETDR